MLRNLLFLGFVASASLSLQQAYSMAFPSNVEEAHFCTRYGTHGGSDTYMYVQLYGEGGTYDPRNAHSSRPFGHLYNIVYTYDANTIEGHWRSGRRSGWFRWAFYDNTGFYGSWGYGHQIAEHERGYWNGKVCTDSTH